MAITDDITAGVETAQTEIGDALAKVKEMGVAIKSIELVDAAADPPVVKIEVALTVDEEGEPEAAAGEPGSIDEFFGV